MVVLLSKIIITIFLLLVSLSASSLNNKEVLEHLKKDYKQTLKMALNKTEFCANKSKNNPVNINMFKNLEAKEKKLKYALFYLSVKNNEKCEGKTLKNLLIATSDYLYALKRYDEKNIVLQEKIKAELTSYQFSVYTGKRLLYEASINYKSISLKDKEKLENIKELQTVFNLDYML